MLGDVRCYIILSRSNVVLSVLMHFASFVFGPRGKMIYGVNNLTK